MSETIKFTAGRVSAYQCEEGKDQSFLWDSSSPGLGVRATVKGAKTYVFQSKLNSATLRITIGSPSSWELSAAQAEARRLKVIVDTGKDPRKLKADDVAAQQKAQEALEIERQRASLTLGVVWVQYVEERKLHWSTHHLDDHIKAIQEGGQKRKRGVGLTIAGPLAELAKLPLVDLTSSCIEAWITREVAKRPTYANLSYRLLKACLNWCAEHPAYSAIVSANPVKSKKVKESLGRPKVKNDVLQREQLLAWFAAVRKCDNPVIAAYLQALLLTGARREELMQLRWIDVDFQWFSMTIRDKIEGQRVIPLTPYVAQLLNALPRRNEWVFSSLTAESGRLTEPTKAHRKALVVAGLPSVSLHGLRRSFASLCEWVEMPSGIGAQIQGHAPQGVREQNYIRRPLDLLRMWHTKIEAWILEQAGVEFVKCEKFLKVIN